MNQYDKRVKHGLSHKHPLYDTWVGMRQRCNSKNHSAYQRYGGAGVTVCERWDSFENFVSDMGEKPKGTSLERIDGAKGYSPDNCIWATNEQQARNRSMTVWIEFNGQTKCVTDWAKEMGISFSSMKERIQKWGKEKALTTPNLQPTRKQA